jgi:3',5'-cyclic AMP phosphodiesterase CpdA
MMYIEEITDSFLSEVIEKRPEALILTGDITFNGALESHEDLAEKLRSVEAAEITVLVLPGNHDVYNPYAASYSEDTSMQVPSASTQDFRNIYREFGPDEALSADTASASYMYQLNDSLRVLMLDFNTVNAMYSYTDETAEWIEKQLKCAQKDGVYVLAAGHQNLNAQNELFRSGYVITNAGKLRQLLTDYGVNLFLSGHMHIQHYTTEDDLTEILTSALSVYPNQYASLVFTEGEVDYHTEETHVNADGFDEYGYYCVDKMSNPTREALAETALTETEQNQIADFFTQANYCYFSGDMVSYEAIDPDGKMMEFIKEELPEFSDYFRQLDKDKGKDFRYYHSNDYQGK